MTMSKREEIRAGRNEAEALLRRSCRMLLATAPEVVDAVTLSHSLGEFGLTPLEWRDIAGRMANEHGLHVNISEPGRCVRIRFTRYAAAEDGVR
jgi:hypothetical protein